MFRRPPFAPFAFVGALLGVAIVAAAAPAARSAPLPQAAEPSPPGGTLNEPAKLPFSEQLARDNLRLPPGFWFDVWATELGNPRNMVVAPDGTLYVTRREQGDVLALNDRDGDAHADEIRTVASGLKLVNGIVLRDNTLYLATDTKVLRAAILADGTLDTLETLIDDLPDAGQHPNRTLGFGPDGKLYISVGSS